MEDRYKKLNKYYKEKFGEKTLKICVDGGFSCPNRDGTCGIGGCIFCSEKGSGELIKNSSNTIQEQVQQYFKSYKAERANKFIVYFQNYSNTYDTLDNLKTKYDSSLIDKRIVGLSVATRPDCIDDDILQLLKSYTDKYYVCIELGLQSADNKIGKIINRGYNTEQFIQTVKLIKKYDIDIVAHIMCGLPGENRESYFLEQNKTKLFEKDNLKDGKYVPKSISETIDLLNKLKVNGVKIHSTYVVKNTKLNEMYQNNKYIPLEIIEYFSDLAYIITHISKEIVVHRICADAPKDILVVPDWNAHKKWIINGFEKILKENNLQQGMFFQ